MKLTIRYLALFFALSGLVALGACVSSPTSESTGQYLDSTAITTKVKASLVRELGLASVTKIEVTTYKGVVQLSGFVKQQADIGKAVAVARQVPGVRAVENSLLVRSKLRTGKTR